MKEKLLDALPYPILFLVAGLILLALRQTNATFDQYLDILRVLIWPLIILLGLLFFRKVLTYFFFSFEEFNFFGAHGRLKNVRELILEKADALYKDEVKQREINEERSVREAELTNLRKVSTKKDENVERLFKIAEKSFDENDQLRKENFTLKEQVEGLLGQIAGLQGSQSQVPLMENADLGSGVQVEPPSQPSHE